MAVYKGQAAINKHAGDAPGIHVTGIVEVMGALKRLSPEAQKRLARDMKEIAQHVVNLAVSKMEFGAGPAARSVKASGTMKGAAIRFPKGGQPWRGDKVGYFPWLAWGGSTGRGHGSSEVKNRAHTGNWDAGSGSIHRPWIGPGDDRYVYPAIGESKDYIGKTAYSAIKEAAQVVDLEVRF